MTREVQRWIDSQDSYPYDFIEMEEPDNDAMVVMEATDENPVVEFEDDDLPF